MRCERHFRLVKRSPAHGACSRANNEQSRPFIAKPSPTARAHEREITALHAINATSYNNYSNAASLSAVRTP